MSFKIVHTNGHGNIVLEEIDALNVFIEDANGENTTLDYWNGVVYYVGNASYDQLLEAFSSFQAIVDGDNLAVIAGNVSAEDFSYYGFLDWHDAELSLKDFTTKYDHLGNLVPISRRGRNAEHVKNMQKLVDMQKNLGLVK